MIDEQINDNVVRKLNEKRNGIKYDQDKLPWDLLPFEALEEVAKVYEMGSKKYKARNWEKGIPYSRVFSALLRHLFAWFKGEDLDRESGLHHLAHVCWNSLALLHYSMFTYYYPMDDRPRRIHKKTNFFKEDKKDAP